MAYQDWLTPAPAPQASVYDTVAPTAAAPLYEMRPMTLGELLDRTFSIFRRRFWLYAGLASVAAAVELVISGAGRVMVLRSGSNPASLGKAMVATSLASFLLYFTVYAVTQAGTCWAMTQTYLGRPASVGTSLRAVRGQWYAWIGIALWQFWSLIWVPVLAIVPVGILAALGRTAGLGGTVLAGTVMVLGVLGGFVFGVWAYLRNSLAIPAKVMEGLPVRKAMRRSKTLIKGSVGRAFVLLLIVAALYIVVGVVQMPLAMFVAVAQHTGHMTTGQVLAEAAVLLVTFAARMLVPPIFSIGSCLIYFDQRVRQEAFDLELLLGSADAGVSTDGADAHSSAAPTEPGYSAPPPVYAPAGYGTAVYTPAHYAPVTFERSEAHAAGLEGSEAPGAEYVPPEQAVGGDAPEV